MWQLDLFHCHSNRQWLINSRSQEKTMELWLENEPLEQYVLLQWPVRPKLSLDKTVTTTVECFHEKMVIIKDYQIWLRSKNWMIELLLKCWKLTLSQHKWSRCQTISSSVWTSLLPQPINAFDETMKKSCTLK